MRHKTGLSFPGEPPDSSRQTPQGRDENLAIAVLIRWYASRGGQTRPAPRHDDAPRPGAWPGPDTWPGPETWIETLPTRLDRRGCDWYTSLQCGRLAQLVRVLARHARGQWFESTTAHHQFRPPLRRSRQGRRPALIPSLTARTGPLPFEVAEAGTIC